MKIAIFASATGSTAEVLFRYAAVVVTNVHDAGVIEKAKKAGIPVEIVERDGLTLEQFGEKILEALGKYEFDFISQNGWEALTPASVCQKYAGRITNNHPAPLDPGYPDFGGKGMKGLVVHQAVLNFSRKIQRPFSSEICIHLVNEQLDRGELLAIMPVEIKGNDDAQTLQDRVKEVEKELIADFWGKVEGSMVLNPIQRGERLILPEEVSLLEMAKVEALSVDTPLL